MKRWEEEYADQVLGGFDPAEGVEPLSHMALGLAGEAGEVADLIKKSQYRNGSLNKTELALELSDALWYLTGLARLEGFTLADLALINVAKLQRRRGAPYDANKLWESISPPAYEVPAIPFDQPIGCDCGDRPCLNPKVCGAATPCQ